MAVGLVGEFRYRRNKPSDAPYDRLLQEIADQDVNAMASSPDSHDPTKITPLMGEATQATLDAWKALAAKGLDGADVDTRLGVTTLDGLNLKPLYTRADALTQASITQSLPGAAPFVRGRTAPEPAKVGAWDIRQRYVAGDAKVTNARILDDLAGGVSSITLQMAAPGQSGLEARATAIEAALADVHLEMLDVTVEAGEDYIGAAQSLMGVWSSRGIDNALCRGAIHGDPVGAFARAGSIEGGLYASIETIGHFISSNVGDRPQVTLALADGRLHHDAGATDAQELAAIVATAVTYARAAERSGCSLAQTWPTLHAAVALDADLFTGIAKLRAVRRLLWRVVDAAGAGSLASQMKVTAETSARMMSSREPYVNLLRTTVAAMAGAMGGADALIVRPFTSSAGVPDAFAHRMARNTQIMLQEESGLGVVADPAGGSWYIEHLTDQLAQKAWSIFQGLEANGGIEEALKSGQWQQQVADADTARIKRVAEGRDVLIGVTTFAQLDAKPAEAGALSPAPELRNADEIAIPLTPTRTAAPFEALRARADRVAEENNERPSVHMANMGARRAFAARQSFTTNLLATAGLAASLGEGGDDIAVIADAFAASGDKIACVCGADDDYATHAASLIAALKANGAVAVYLAGRPGPDGSGWDAATLETAGLTGTLHMRSNRLTALTEICDALGLPQAEGIAA